MTDRMTHYWYWRKWLPDRRGMPCRILATGSLNSALVEFADGYTVVTVRFAVRRVGVHHGQVDSAPPFRRASEA